MRNHKEEVDFSQIKVGDIIKSIKQSGPYFTRENGERVYMGCYGTFKVRGILPNGLLVKEMNGELSSCSHEEFMYMGPTVASDVLGSITNEKHKLMRIK